jgi:hypothetical protein
MSDNLKELQQCSNDELVALRKMASKVGDTALRDSCGEMLRRRGQETLAATGQLVKIIESPCEANGWRHVIRHEGDFLAWFDQFRASGARCKLNPLVGKVTEPVTVDRLHGERVAVLKAGQRIVDD